MIVQQVAFVRMFGGDPDPDIVNRIGCSVSRAGVGVYDFALDRPIDSANTQYSIGAFVEAGGDGTWATSDLNDSIKRFQALDAAGAPTDNFDLSIGISMVSGGGTAGG